MTGDTSEQTTSSSGIGQVESANDIAGNRITAGLDNADKQAYEQFAEALRNLNTFGLTPSDIDKILTSLTTLSSGVRPLHAFPPTHFNFDNLLASLGGLNTLSPGGLLTKVNQPTLRIAISEEPLTAQNLLAIIAAITDLHTRCWVVQQKQFADLMDYSQTRDPRFLKKANLRIGMMTHNSPAIIDFLINSSGSVTGAAVLAFALKNAIDAVAQTPLRFRATKLKNEREALNQQIAAQQAEAENKDKEQERQIAAQKAQLELEKQQIELDRQRLELQKDRVKIVLEIATTTFNQLQIDIDAGQREMIIHSLVPPLLQIAAIDSSITTIIPKHSGEENKESSENK